MHFLNMPSFVEGLFNLVRSFMKEKMRERIKVHPKGDYSLLQEELGKEVLPVEYGGTNGSVVEHASKLLAYAQSARAVCRDGVLESKAELST